MITIIYPYRNRELSRIKKSLDSLVWQSNKDFCVVFVNYGSDFEISRSINELLNEYEFVKNIHSFHNNQLWSRSKAINIGLRIAETEYVFIADIDIIFHVNFVEKLIFLKNTTTNYYFQVGYLDEEESLLNKEFNDYKIISKSIPEGKGLSFFKLDSLLSVNGFDEFFHIWGAEDEDIHDRLRLVGYNHLFYNTEILLLHQWHPSFQSMSEKKLTLEPVISNIFQLNKQKLRFNRENKVLKSNNKQWGKQFLKENYDKLQTEAPFELVINKKNNIDYFVNIVLPSSNNQLIKVRFIVDDYQRSIKYKVKMFLGVRSNYYSLKHINDLILKDIILYYNNYPYIFKINSDFESIDFIIIK